MAINICTVTGNVKNLLGSAVANCTVKVSVITPFFHQAGPSWVSGELESVLTNSSGDFSIGVIETATPGQKVTFTFDYFDGVANRKQKQYTVLIPNQASALLIDLVASNTLPSTPNSYPASNVTVSPISGLTSTDTQAALAELETQVQGKQITGSYIVALSADVTAAGPGSAAATVNSVGGQTASNVAAGAVLANAATNANTASAIVKRDASGNFSAGTVTANLTGNASGTAASITGNLTGDVTSTGMATTVASVGGSTATLVHSAELAANAATNANTVSTIVKRDASGNFSAGTITASLTGNVTGNASGTAASITGTNPVANGGTGVTTLPAHNVLVGNGTSAVTGVAPSTNGNVLTSNGTDWVSSAPTSSPTPSGAMTMYGGFTAPSGWLFTDGSAVSRTTYAALFAALSISTTGNTTSGSAIITAIPSTTGWSVGMPVSGSGIPAAATILSVDSASQIHISANATATATGAAFVVAPYGIGDGSTTFNLPDSRGAFFRGIGTSGKLTYKVGGAVVGPVLGEYQQDMMQGHKHTLSTGMSPNNNTAATTGAGPLGQFTTPTLGDPVPTTYGQPNLGNENRPFGLGTNFIIKT